MSDDTSRDLTERLIRIEAALDEVREEAAVMNAKLDRMLGLYDALGSIAAGLPPRIVAALHSMSPAEHVALQMVLDNRSNHEISVCLDVDEARVREWVNSVTDKLGGASRAEIRKRLMPVLAVIPADEYLRASGGIPKDWNDKYGVGGIPDPYRHIYHPDSA